MFGFCSFKYAETPAIVPPVPVVDVISQYTSKYSTIHTQEPKTNRKT